MSHPYTIYNKLKLKYFTLILRRRRRVIIKFIFTILTTKGRGREAVTYGAPSGVTTNLQSPPTALRRPLRGRGYTLAYGPKMCVYQTYFG